ncbi:hypothetical protein H5410_031835 [Solanum commersonii]|uniref:Transposase MuDR plant domain-containing protein n=1 Tax=Solanum commersonii TaxID=4109 RepID=A0A9J5YJF3_SOLCO|nr:hypothetical protein H5410_031835 [Solanum commersonii]
MTLTIVTLQFHYGGCFVFVPTLRYDNGITSVEKINIDVDELHIMLFHKIALELGVENVETFGYKGADFVNVYVVHPISIPLVVEEILELPSTNADVSSSPQQDNVDMSSSPHKNRADLSSSPQIDRADVGSSQLFDENENRDLNQNQSHLVEEQSPLVEEQGPAPRSNIQEQVKEKTDRVNLDEIPSGHVGERGRFEGNLGGDDLYFDSSDLGSDISEDEGDPVENDEVVDPTPRKESTKIYFDPIAKKKGVNIKLKPNEKEKIRCNKKGCPWHIPGNIDGNTGNFSVKTHFPIQSLIQKQYGLYVSKTSCRKAKLRVMNEHMGDFKEEFARLYDYAEQLKTTNPETTVSIRTSKNTIPGKKVGWKEGCRRIIGLDSAFLKSVCKGELLTCISKDGNNQMYLIAWAVVDKETKDTWSLFLKCIKHDLELTEVFILHLLMYCQMLKLDSVLGIYGQTGRKTGGVKKGEENSGRLPGHHLRYFYNPNLMTQLRVGIVEALLKYNKEAWCRAYFKEHSKCDVEIRVKVMERMIQMREFSKKWITDVSPMAMDTLRKNAEIANNCEVKFNGDFGFAIHDPPYKHVVDLKKKKETYLKAYNRFIQPMTNMKMWPKSDRPSIEPPEITAMPGRPGKIRRKDSDEPDKKKFGKATRKERKIKCSLCKTFGHNKKGCPTLKNVVAGTSVATAESQSSVNAGPSAGCTLSAGLISARRPINASSSGVRLVTALASGGRPTSATSSDVRQLSTQQSTSSSAGQKRKTTTALRGGATLAYKKPRPKKAKTVGYGLLFGSGDSVTERSGNTDRVLHSATLSSSTPTNIDLGYKPNGLRWKERAAITQRQLREESYRSTQGTPSTQSTQGTH